MDTARDYLTRLQLLAFRDVYGFEVTSRRATTESDWKAARAVAAAFGADGLSEELVQTDLRPEQLFRKMERDLLHDARACMEASQASVLEKTALAFMPTGQVNAFALAYDGWGNALDGYAIGVNYGLFYVANVLVEAVVTEKMEVDGESQKGEGREFFQAGLAFLRAPSIDAVRGLPSLAPRFPEDVRAQVAQFVASLSTVMLTFVVLHEVAHIHHGDVHSTRRLHALPDSADVVHAVAGAPASWEAELAADRFALEGLWRRRATTESAWSNFFQVELLFRFLDVAEGDATPSDSDHPPALERLEQLRRRQLELAGPPPEDHSPWLADRVRVWSQASPSHVGAAGVKPVTAP